MSTIERPLPQARVVEVAGSTQADLLGLVAAPGATDAWPHLSALRAERQVAGVGRRGRGWETGRLRALTASVVLRPALAPAALGWLPVLTGLAVVEALAAVGVGAGLKWPNDVVVDAPAASDEPGWGRRRKVAGVLAQALPPGPGGPVVVVGVGVNLDGEPPVPWATTLAAAGAPAVDAAALLDGVRRALDGLLTAGPAGWPARAEAACVSLGQAVRAQLPGGGEVVGTAVGLADGGALVVEEDGGTRTLVTAADVEHLRTVGSAE